MLNNQELLIILPVPFAAIVILLIYLVLRTKRFYFIRHGETLLNEQHIHQGSEGALSEAGRNQAQMVGQFLKRFPIGRILSSEYPRARETALAINTYLKVPIVYTALLSERRNPVDIVGQKRDDIGIKRIMDQMDRTYHTDEYRFSNEENFVEVKERARKCLNFLVLHGTRETAVVTHQVFLKMLVAYLLYREGLHAGDFAKVSWFNYSDNAGITICEFRPWKLFSRTRGWSVVSFNAQPHN
jgi:broad specificity phosphatase PhoE